ncbi:putative two component, sigma54 specific, transcriptional regulator, Fis family [Pseudodesulfovibrio piezophilus C1TLV30]|uniref:Putative two component, sigma54 specific, transcriptional regulator, Fis family n=2 Tax=Pseudodesulfovibrio TaxID=2035811 RepID=M1WKW1_PSEP2|nr:putative two component, sigma54 specific, transcriptional regulator, Fis family [Pseudodesulfovibrio piezophilus C1TLV30]
MLELIVKEQRDMATVLILDDDLRLNQTMVRIMGRMGLEADSAATIAEARELMQGRAYKLVFLDVRLPDGNGLDILPEILDTPSRPEVVILTGKGDPDGAELAIHAGAWDYLLKPSSVKQTMLCAERALKYHKQKLVVEPASKIDLGSLVGVSPKMEACYEQIALAARSDSNVLITGETGTGKELFAQTIHKNCSRREFEFVPVDCASLNKELIESVLFGHKRGAFTGAERDRVGLVKVADRGTLFLDEVGDMNLDIQKTFLRVLQERAFRPVGDTKEVSSNFRLMAATNRDLDADIDQEMFRQDLLYRLKTIHIKLPPLRERDGDIKLLALFRVNQLARQYDREMTLAPESFDVLSAYAWPGNVRELFAVIETAFLHADGAAQIIPRHLPSQLRVAAMRAQVARVDGSSVVSERESGPDSLGMEAVKQGVSLKGFKGDMEKHYLEELRTVTGGDIKRMIEISGCSQSHLYSLLKKAGLSLK